MHAQCSHTSVGLAQARPNHPSLVAKNHSIPASLLDLTSLSLAVTKYLQVQRFVVEIHSMTV